MKAAFLLSLLFTSIAARSIYLCGVTTTVDDSTFPAEPTLKGFAPSNFNAISFGSMYAESGDIEGAAAIRNNLNLPDGQYSFGYELRTNGTSKADNQMPYSLIVGHDATWASGAVYPLGNGFPYSGNAQRAYIGGSLTASNAGILAECDPNQGSIDAQFDSVQAYYVAVQGAFAALSVDITPVFQYSGMTVTCPDSTFTGLYTVGIDGDQLSATTYWSKVNCNDLAQFNFIVAGTGNVVFSGGDFDHDINYVLWNVIGSGRTIRLGNASPHGTLLAPNNIYNQPNTGVWQGQVIAADFQQVLQINRQFCPTPPAPQSPAPCLTWETACAGLNFGQSDSFTQYNVISFGDYTANTGDVEGRLAAKGDVQLGCGYSIAAEIHTNANNQPDAAQTYSLISGGSVNWCSGALYVEQIELTNQAASSIPNDILVSGRVVQSADLSATFDAAQGCYCAMSDALAAKPVTTTHTIQYTGLFITCNDATATDNVINLSAAEFSQFTYYSLSNCLYQSAWTINVDATASGVEITGDSFPGNAGGIVYNIAGANTVYVHDTAVTGSILACHATLNQPSGVIMGKVVVNSVEATLQINKPTCAPTTNVTITVVASGTAAQGSNTASVYAATSILVGDVTPLGRILSVDGSSITFSNPLAQSVVRGQTIAQYSVSSVAGRGKVANPTSDMQSSSASAIGLAFFAVAAALLF